MRRLVAVAWGGVQIANEPPPNFAKRLDANREQRLLIFVEKYGASSLKF